MGIPEGAEEGTEEGAYHGLAEQAPLYVPVTGPIQFKEVRTQSETLVKSTTRLDLEFGTKKYTHKSSFAEATAHLEELLVDPVSNTAETIRPLSLVSKRGDSDNPSYD